MAEFTAAFDKMIRNEGGFVNHNVSGDRGGQTFAGIARNFHPTWDGWRLIDNNEINNPRLTDLVRDFYKTNYWDRVKGDDLTQQRIAESIFDFAVNAGVKTASKLAQLVVGASPDGIIGSKTTGALNKIDEEVFIVKYALAKVTRYVEIVRRDRSQDKFLLGWLNRTLGSIA